MPAISAAEFLPGRPTLTTLREAAQGCRGCDLYLHATQAVLGEGPARARLMLIGEQPGDQEDLQGHPFVGPAGKLLHRALLDAGIDSGDAYITNAVKHFKFEERGKRRLHKKPRVSEIKACRPWLEAEVAIVRPRVIVCLGATAALSVFGGTYRLTQSRGKFVEHAWALRPTSTIHPSSILREPDPESRDIEYRHFVDDLKLVRGELSK